MKNIWFLVAAYSVIWILLAYYFFKLGNKIEKLNKRISTLESDNLDVREK